MTVYVNDAGTWKRSEKIYKNENNTTDCYFNIDVNSGSLVETTNHNHTLNTFNGSIIDGTGGMGEAGKIIELSPGEVLKYNLSPSIDLTTTDLSIGGWIYWSHVPGTENIHPINFGDSFYILIGSNMFTFVMHDVDGTPYQVVLPGASENWINAGEWVHYALTWEASAKKLRFFKDFAWVQGQTLPSEKVIRTPVAMTKSWVDVSGTYPLCVDAIRIYTKLFRSEGSTLCDEWIQNLGSIISAWNEVDQLYVNDSGTWKLAHYNLYSGNPWIEYDFDHYTGNGTDPGSHMYNQSTQQGVPEYMTMYNNDAAKAQLSLVERPWPKWGRTLTNARTDTSNYYYYSTPRHKIDINTQNLTISFRVKLANNGSNQRILHWLDADDDWRDKIIIYQRSNKTLSWFLGGAATITSGVLSMGTEYHIFCVYCVNPNTSGDHYQRMFTVTGTDRADAVVTEIATKWNCGGSAVWNNLVMTISPPGDGADQFEGDISMVRIHKRIVYDEEMKILAFEY